GATNSRMSAPAENARSPAPVTMITLTASSIARASKQAVSSRRMTSFIALWTSGRFIVTVATASSTSQRIASYFVLTPDSFQSVESADDLAGAKVGDRWLGVPGGAQHVVGVLAERRRRADVAGGRRGKEQRGPGQREAPDVGVVVLARQPVVARERMPTEVVDAVHGARGDVVALQRLEPLIART